MKILRTIETFLPHVCGPTQQAFQISRRLEARGIPSPVITTFCDVDPMLPPNDRVDGISVTRLNVPVPAMRYCFAPGLSAQLKRQEFDILHSHNYRNFLSDYGFFLRPGEANRLS